MTERKRKSNRYWLASVAVAVLAIAGAACTKKETAQPQDTATIAAATGDTMGVAADDGLDDVPDRDTAKTRKYLDQLRPHWRLVQDNVKIECEGECGAGHDTVHVAFYVHQLTVNLDAQKLVDRSNSNHSRGHFAVKIVNRDAFKFDGLGLMPNDSVFLWGGKTGANGKRAFALFRIDSLGKMVGAKRVYGAIFCKMQSPPGASDVHLKPKNKCEDGDSTRVVLYSDPPPPNFKEPIHDQGLWFSCTGGCCQTTTFGPY